MIPFLVKTSHVHNCHWSKTKGLSILISIVLTNYLRLKPCYAAILKQLSYMIPSLVETSRVPTIIIDLKLSHLISALLVNHVRPWSVEGLEINVNDYFNKRSPTVLAPIKLKKIICYVNSSDTWRLMDHKRTLRLKTDSSSWQVVFPSRIFSKLSQYGVFEELGTGVATKLFDVLTYIM